MKHKDMLEFNTYKSKARPRIQMMVKSSNK